MRTFHGARMTIAGARCPTTTFLAACVALAGSGCGGRDSSPVEDSRTPTIALRSPSFAEGGMIPRDFTCDGANRSPALAWSHVPEACRSLVLTCDDPDAPAGTFAHWVIINLPPGAVGLKEGVPAGGAVPVAAIEATGPIDPQSTGIQGQNDFGDVGYGGPCPPGGTHRYVFRIYALDATIPTGADRPTRAGVLKAIEGHVMAEGRLIGKYSRSR